MKDTISRTVYGRLFKGSLTAQSETGPWNLLGSVFDLLQMPALSLDSGNNIYREFSLGQNESVSLQLPQNYANTSYLYVAIGADLPSRVTYVTSDSVNNQIILKGTTAALEGMHAAFWGYQGRLNSLTVSVPSTADGGATTNFQAFMYTIPDLSVAESFYDRQIGLGVSGDS